MIRRQPRPPARAISCIINPSRRAHHVLSCGCTSGPPRPFRPFATRSIYTLLDTTVSLIPSRTISPVASQSRPCRSAGKARVVFCCGVQQSRQIPQLKRLVKLNHDASMHDGPGVHTWPSRPALSSSVSKASTERQRDPAARTVHMNEAPRAESSAGLFLPASFGAPTGKSRIGLPLEAVCMQIWPEDKQVTRAGGAGSLGRSEWQSVRASFDEDTVTKDTISALAV